MSIMFSIVLTFATLSYYKPYTYILIRALVSSICTTWHSRM